MRVLAVSGGGAQGFYAACVLERVEARVGPLAEVCAAAGGTSIGAALAAGVALGVPAAVMREAVRAHAPKIFKPLGAPDPRIEKMVAAARGANRARHRTDPWRATLEGLLGGARMRDARIPLSIPAINLTAGGRLDVFRSHPLSSADPDPDTPVVEAVLASSAAPTFFRPHRWNGVVYADGGMAANAPDAMLVAEAGRRWPGQEVAMLSVGTGLSVFAAELEGDLDWGWRSGCGATASPTCRWPRVRTARFRWRARPWAIATAASTPPPRTPSAGTSGWTVRACRR